MKKDVSRGKASLLMLVVIGILLILSTHLSYFPSTNPVDATSSGRGADDQSSEDLGKEEQDESARGGDSQTSEDLGKEEQDEEEGSSQSVGETAPANEEVDSSGVLGAEFRGGETIKEGSEIAGGEESESDPLSELRGGDTNKQAPLAISGDNVYVVWWTNNTSNGNDEVLFRVSTDGGATFGDKINLSNTTNADSWKAEIDSDADSVVVTWWEQNQTSDIPVMRVSTDNGATFGPLLMLATNGTIG
jgi:hypothetical protein